MLIFGSGFKIRIKTDIWTRIKFSGGIKVGIRYGISVRICL